MMQLTQFRCTKVTPLPERPWNGRVIVGTKTGDATAVVKKRKGTGNNLEMHAHSGHVIDRAQTAVHWVGGGGSKTVSM